jgi:hypothetical protein
VILAGIERLLTRPVFNFPTLRRREQACVYVLLVVAGCAVVAVTLRLAAGPDIYRRANRVKEGMAPAEVEAIFGRPPDWHRISRDRPKRVRVEKHGTYQWHGDEMVFSVYCVNDAVQSTTLTHNQPDRPPEGIFTKLRRFLHLP